MKQSRSFKEYVSNRFEDAFYDAIGRYVEGNIHSLAFIKNYAAKRMRDAETRLYDE